MLTFSDLVLLLLAFVAIGVLMDRAHGPNVLTTELRASAPPPVAPARREPFTLVEEVAPASNPVPAGTNAHLRALADRLETRLAAAAIPARHSVMVGMTSIIIEIGAIDAASRSASILPSIVPIIEPRPSFDAFSRHDRALASTARLAHELIAGDPLFAVRAVTARVGGAPTARIEIRRAG